MSLQLVRSICLALVCVVAPSTLMAAGSVVEQWVSAISNDRTDQLTQLLQRSNTQNLLSRPNQTGKTALMVACKSGELKLAQHWVTRGASVFTKTKTGGSSLMFAALANQVAIAQWLHTLGVGVNDQGSNGWSAATIAGAKGFDEFLEWLIDVGANMDAPDVYNFTPLLRAVDNRHLSTAAVLLKRAGAQVNHKDESGSSALHYAVANQHEEMIRLLLAYNANVHQQNSRGISALKLSEAYPNSHKLLLSHSSPVVNGVNK